MNSDLQKVKNKLIGYTCKQCKHVDLFLFNTNYFLSSEERWCNLDNVFVNLSKPACLDFEVKK